MSRPAYLPVVVMLISVLAAPMAFGQQIADGLRVSRQGLHYNAHALGMGNAHSTVGYDFSALLFNPATMAVSGKFSWTVTANANAFKSSSDYYGTPTSFKTSKLSGDQTGITMPFRLDSVRTLVIGLGYTQSKDFNNGYRYEGLNAGTLFPSFVEGLAFREDPTARALGLSYPVFDAFGNRLGDETILGNGLFETGYLLGEGGMSHYTFGAAIEAANNVYFGASASYNTGHYTSDLQLTGADVNDIYPIGVSTVPGDPQTDGFVGTSLRNVRDKQYRGWDARFGVLYKLANFIGVSTAFKLPTSHRVTEEAFVSGRSDFAANAIVVPETRSTSSYNFVPPAELTVGAMVNLWLITGTAQATYVDYPAMRVTSGVGTVPDRTTINRSIREELAPVVNLNVGAEARLPWTGLSARAGAIYHPSPFLDDPSRFAQKAATIGFGMNSNDALQFDVAYAYAWRGENKDQQTGAVVNGELNDGYHTVLFTMRVAL